MEALGWASIIAASILLAGVLGKRYWGNSRSSVAVLGVAVGWTAWTLGLSTFFVGYALTGPLLGFQLGLIATVVVVYFVVSMNLQRQRTRAEQAEEYNRLLKRHIAELAEEYEGLGSSEPPPVVAVVQGAKNHRIELLNAISHANDRLIVLSGWVSGYALEGKVKKSLVSALKRGVCVQIGWGYTANTERPRAANATEKWLKQMANEYPDRFRIRYFRNHSKLLVLDDSYAVIGSFNWLSNMGISENDELSLVVKDSDYVSALAAAAETKF